MDDSALLRQFAQTQSHAVFRDLVGRYTSLVYASALTRLSDAHAAQDVTQAVFLTLALKAKDLRPDTSLPGWLFTTTRYVAARYQRGEQRRREREMRAFEQHQLHQPKAPSAVWEDLRPHLAGALDSLSGADREAVLLRFYRQASHRQIAEQLRISEDAAAQRIHRALDKLRRLFAKKGVTLSVAGLAGGLTASASAAPVGLAGVVSAAVLTGAGGTLAATETLMLAKGALKAMFIAKLKTVSLAAAACLVVAGSGVVVATQLSWSTPDTPQPKLIPVAAKQPAAPPAASQSAAAVPEPEAATEASTVGGSIPSGPVAQTPSLRERHPNCTINGPRAVLVIREFPEGVVLHTPWCNVLVKGATLCGVGFNDLEVWFAGNGSHRSGSSAHSADCRLTLGHDYRDNRLKLTVNGKLVFVYGNGTLVCGNVSANVANGFAGLMTTDLESAPQDQAP